MAKNGEQGNKGYRNLGHGDSAGTSAKHIKHLSVKEVSGGKKGVSPFTFANNIPLGNGK